MGENLKFSE